MADRPICDLCSSAPAAWTFAGTGLAGRDLFAVCELCKVLVDRRDLAGLERRCVTLFIRRRGRPPHRQVVATLRQAHRTLLDSITGTPVRLGADQP